MVMESTFRLSDYSWLCGLENQTLTPSIYRNGLAEVYSHVTELSTPFVVLKKRKHSLYWAQTVWDSSTEHLEPICLQ